MQRILMFAESHV